ncbi:MAG: TonB-dependent receptor, partial [Bacteroidota bacterium]
AQKVDVISYQYISRVNAQNTGDLLMSTGNVFVQKSQQGGSSPVIRGFEASRILLVVDGLRMNNLIYRSGHLQNVITVDPNMLEAVEIMYGPSSTLYGSDALGGAVYFRTRQPKLSYDSIKKNVIGNYFTRYSSVNNEKTIHADLNIGGKKWAWLQSYTFSDFGDLTMGRSGHPDFPDFGKRDSFITQINGLDTVIKNSNPLVQKFSGYKQWDILQKILYQPSKKISHGLNIQFSNTTNIPRYDRLQDKRDFGGTIGQTLRWAEWYYGPQTRLFSTYEIQIGKTGLFDQVRALVNYQYVEESRFQREFKRYDRLDERKEKVGIAGWTIDVRKINNKHEWTIGTDGQWNTLTSIAKRTDIRTGSSTKLDTRYPDGMNEQWNAAIYTQHLYKIHNKWILNDGIRWQYTSLQSTLSDNSFFNLPYEKIIQKNNALTGNIGLVFLPEKNSRISLNFSGGFRAPNVDDLSKIFESNTARNQLVIPNPDIKPERTYNAELTVTKTFLQKIKLDGNLFYTRFTNALAKAPLPLNGQDSVLYNGVMSQTLANLNVNNAFLYGYSLAIQIKMGKNLTADANLNFTKGRFVSYDGEASDVYEKQADGTYLLVKRFVRTRPMDHIPPLFGKFNITYQTDQLTTDFFILWNGAKKLEDYNPDGEDNVQYTSPVGALAWHTLNMRASYSPIKKVSIQLAVENILDARYRVFASGLSAGGRNVSLTIRVSH